MRFSIPNRFVGSGQKLEVPNCNTGSRFEPKLDSGPWTPKSQKATKPDAQSLKLKPLKRVRSLRPLPCPVLRRHQCRGRFWVQARLWGLGSYRLSRGRRDPEKLRLRFHCRASRLEIARTAFRIYTLAGLYNRSYTRCRSPDFKNSVASKKSWVRQGLHWSYRPGTLEQKLHAWGLGCPAELVGTL